MPGASLGSLDLLGLAPRGMGPDAADRLQRAVQRVPAALDAGFASLDYVDPGAYWVLRELNVELTVPASEPDAGQQSLRIARALAEAVALVVRRGPSSRAVRFTGRAAYVAAFVRARLAGAGLGWVFGRLAQLDPLPAGDALPAAARLVDVPLLDVVAELLRPGGGWSTLVQALTGAEAGRLAAAIDAAAAGGAPAPGHRSPAQGVAGIDGGAAPPHGGAEAAAARSRLARLEDRFADMPGAPDASGVASAWRSIPPVALSGAPAASPRPDRTTAPAPPPRGDGPATAARDSGPARETVPTATLISSPGAAAATLLPDLDALLREHDDLAAPDDAAGGVRAAILAGVLGGAVEADDPSIAALAGVTHPPEPGEVAALVDGPLTRWLDTLDPPLAFVHESDADRFEGSTLRAASGALLRSFARHLHGFGRSSAAHLVPRVLPLGGRLAVGDELIEATVPGAQLAVLLALAGLDAFAHQPAWLPVPVLVRHEDSP